MSAKNVILLTVDSLRSDRLSCYAGKDAPVSTPHMDAFASQGALFTNAFSQGPYTTYSMPSIFTGKYPSRLKPMADTLLWKNIPSGVLVEDVPTLTEMLKQAGYHTAGFHSNPLLSRFFRFEKAFDVFYDDVVMAEGALPRIVRLWGTRLHRFLRVDPYMGAGELNDRALAWLENAPEPFFLWIHYMDVHGPYLARKVLKYVSRAERVWRRGVRNPESVTEADRNYLWDCYHSQIRRLDKELHRLWDALESRQLFDRSLVMLTADHGEEFYEHGDYSHAHKLYDELTHVPLIIRHPGSTPRRVEEIVGVNQLLPTAMDYVGATMPEGKDYAASLLPVLQGQALPGNKYVISETGPRGNEGVSVRSLEWKLITRGDLKTDELYHLVSDPAEKRNVIGEHSVVAQEFRKEADRHRSQYSGDALAPAAMSAEEKKMLEKRLEDLGYLD